MPGISITPGYRQESEKEQLAKACGPVADDQLARLSLAHDLTCTLVSDNITQSDDLTQKHSHNTRVRKIVLNEVRGGKLLCTRVMALYRECVCSLHTYLFKDDQTQGPYTWDDALPLR